MTDDERADLNYWYKYVEQGKKWFIELLAAFQQQCKATQVEQDDKTIQKDLKDFA